MLTRAAHVPIPLANATALVPGIRLRIIRVEPVLTCAERGSQVRKLERVWRHMIRGEGENRDSQGWRF